MFDWSGLLVRRSLSIGIGLLLIIIIIVATLTVSLRAQESTPENPATGTIQGTLRDDVGAPVEGARVSYSSSATDTKGLTRSGKDGAYGSEPVPPGVYGVRVEGRDMQPAESSVTVVAGGAVTADFKLEWINPGPVRLEPGPPAATTRYACREAAEGGGVTGVSSVDTSWTTGPSTS